MQLTRRQLFKSAGALAGMAACPLVMAENLSLSQYKALHLYNVHTGEQVKATIWAEGDYQMDEIVRLDHLMRDYRTDEIKPITRDMYEYLYSLQQLFHAKQPINIISGYRCQATNDMLRRNTYGVAKKSMHVQARAVDLSIPKVSHNSLYKAALAMRAGGVGSYPKSGFVHIDNGRLRHWHG